MQTLAQLVTPDPTIRGVSVVDRPAMPVRGAIEGFYGSPWTQEERLAQLAFYGSVKLNTYVYAPKDDPYHRDRWREPYPAAELDRLGVLVDAATAHHVRFTFAVSPGVSICYSDAADTEALVAKLQALYDLGARAFNLALDDIDAGRWNCPGDASAYGPPSLEAAARAQVGLANALQQGFVAGHPDTHPLQFVPTEYRGVRNSGYRTALRDGLDPAIQVMWTGRYVVPPGISVADAEAAAGVFGRPPLVWDNTPVNDFPPTEGRLLLGPYTRREPGLSAHVAGVVLNPMNQAAASTVALTGAADFTWNDAAYDPARAHRVAAERLLGGPAEPPEPGDVDAVARLPRPREPGPDVGVERHAVPAPGPGAGRGARRLPGEPGRPATRPARSTASRLRPRAAAGAGHRPRAGRWGLRRRRRAVAAGARLVERRTRRHGRRPGRPGGGRRGGGRRRVRRGRPPGRAGPGGPHDRGRDPPQGPVRVGDGVLDTFLDEAQGLA